MVLVAPAGASPCQQRGGIHGRTTSETCTRQARHKRRPLTAPARVRVRTPVSLHARIWDSASRLPNPYCANNKTKAPTLCSPAKHQSARALVGVPGRAPSTPGGWSDTASPWRTDRLFLRGEGRNCATVLSAKKKKGGKAGASDESWGGRGLSEDSEGSSGGGGGTYDRWTLR
jgi:uncharacterized membrane protein YgcG